MISLLPAQDDFCYSTDPFPALVGGLGSGKTRAATMRLLLLMADDPGTNTLMTMPTYDLLRLRAIPGFEEDLAAIGVPYILNKSEWSIEIPAFGGKVYFRSYDRPERLIAFECGHSICDELDTLPKEKAAVVWRKVSERTRQKTKRPNSIGVVTTPDHGIHGFTHEKWVKRSQPGYRIYKAKTVDNPFLPDGYVEQIRANYDPQLADMYLNGEFVSLTESKVYHFFDRKENHSDREYQIGERVEISLDFNIGGCCAVVHVIESGDPIAVSEFVSHDTHDFVNNVLAKFDHKKVTVYPDASGRAGRTNATQSDIQIIESAGIAVDAPNANPPVRDRINCMNRMISHRRYKVNTNKCPELTHALETQGYDKKGEPEKFDEHPSIDDWVDSAGYFIHRRYPIDGVMARGVRVG